MLVDRKMFTGKLKAVDSVGDYNHKMFKELEKYDEEKGNKGIGDNEVKIDSDF
jgi:hypothetical protein